MADGMDLGGDETSLPPPSPPLAATPGMVVGTACLTPLPLPTVQPATVAADDRLRSLLEPPPPRSKGRKGKARARTPPPAPSPPCAPLTRAAAAKTSCTSSSRSRAKTAPQPFGSQFLVDKQLSQDVEPTIPQSLKRKVAALGDARSKRPRLEIVPDVPESDFAPPSKLLTEQFTLLLGNGPMTLVWNLRSALSYQVNTAANGAGETDTVSAPSEQSSRIKSRVRSFCGGQPVVLDHLFGHLHRTSAWNLVQRESIRQSELKMSALSREISSILHCLVATDPDDSFRDLYVEDNDAMAALVDVLSSLAPGSLPTTDPHPDSRTSLSKLASLLEGVPTPSWFPRPDHRFLPCAVPPQENISDAADAAGSVDTDTALAELDDLDEQVAILDSLTSAK
ncbi:hypothetical protein BDZ97DRAFT_1764644 [Flammula alnicola]|nr:hypothetical protein BDZ97DRAFT_1764644 [Flammula alnicola]